MEFAWNVVECLKCLRYMYVYKDVTIVSWVCIFLCFSGVIKSSYSAPAGVKKNFNQDCSTETFLLHVYGHSWWSVFSLLGTIELKNLVATNGMLFLLGLHSLIHRLSEHQWLTGPVTLLHYQTFQSPLSQTQGFQNNEHHLFLSTREAVFTWVPKFILLLLDLDIFYIYRYFYWYEESLCWPLSTYSSLSCGRGLIKATTNSIQTCRQKTRALKD